MKRAFQLLRGYRALALTVLGAKALTLLINALSFPRLRPEPVKAGRRVSLLIPARDEALNLAETLPGMLAQGASEVIVLDDHSSDDTARTARDLGARVISGRHLLHDLLRSNLPTG